MWQKINDTIDNLAASLRSVSRLVASLLMLGFTCGLVFALYKGVLYAIASKPWWMKILGF